MPTASRENESILLAEVANGSREAFCKLYTRHLNNLVRYVSLVNRSQEETEEIIQEVFIKIWEHRERLREVDSFKSYLFRCAKNKLLDNFRRQAVKRRAFVEIARRKTIAATTTTDEAEYKEYYYLVQQAIEHLPPQRKLIFRLKTEGGYTPSEIADQLNISSSVVKKQMYKAAHFVREYLVKNGEISLQCLLFITWLFL